MKKLNIEVFIREVVLRDTDVGQEAVLPFPTFGASYKRNQILTEYGQIEKRGYFLIDGIIQCSIQKDGEERIIDFIFPGNFVTAYNSFIQDVPSDIELLALSECKVEYLFKADIKERYKDSLIANQFGRYIKEKMVLEKLDKEKRLLSNTAEENYRDLLKNRPEIIEHISVNKIAKYLGIHPESLSRIRAKLIS